MPLEAAMRADGMLEKGDLEGLVVWKRIVRAVEEIERTEPKLRNRTAVLLAGLG